MGQADMWRGYEPRHGGALLGTSAHRRQRAVRRRWLALSVILGVALAGAVLGEMSAARGDANRPTPPGPLSYLAQ